MCLCVEGSGGMASSRGRLCFGLRIRASAEPKLTEKSLREGEAEPKFTEKGRGKTARRKEGVALEWGGFWGWFFIFGGCVSEKDE